MKKQTSKGRNDNSSAGGGISTGPQSESTVKAAEAYKAEMATAANLVVGRLVSFLNSTVPLVDFPLNVSAQLLEARSIVDLTEKELGQEVVLAFEDGDARRPIVMGIVRVSKAKSTAIPEGSAASNSRSLEVETDGDTLTISADKQLILRCGKSSITLTRAGKVILRGEYLLSRSSGVNRIKGGSVQIN